MKEHRLTETDMRMALRQRGHTESQVAHLLGDIKADAWDDAVEHISQSEADVTYVRHYKPHNPYRKEQANDL